MRAIVLTVVGLSLCTASLARADGSAAIGEDLFKHSYSAAMRGAGLTWDPATLDSYLTNPRAKVPGTKMTFVGLPKANDRADIIGYLNTLK